VRPQDRLIALEMNLNKSN